MEKDSLKKFAEYVQKIYEEKQWKLRRDNPHSFKGVHIPSIPMPKGMTAKEAKLSYQNISIYPCRPPRKHFFKEGGWSLKSPIKVKHQPIVTPTAQSTKLSYSKVSTGEKSRLFDVTGDLLYYSKPLSSEYKRLFNAASKAGECCLRQDIKLLKWKQTSYQGWDRVRRVVGWKTFARQSLSSFIEAALLNQKSASFMRSMSVLQSKKEEPKEDPSQYEMPKYEQQINPSTLSPY